jgi:hypothetical protein
MKTWRLIPSANPSELGIVISIPQDEVGQLPNSIPAIGDQLKTLAYGVPESSLATDDRYGLYIFTMSTTQAVGGNIHVDFYYAKNKTAEERNTAFDSYTETQRIQWPAVLEWIQFGQETGFPLSQNFITGSQAGMVTSPRWLVRRGYRPSLNLETQVKVEKFLSEVPWPDWATVSTEPQPTEVSWDLVGNHGNMGRCLHPEVRVPTNSNGYRVISTAGVISSSSSTYNTEQVFPRTNMIRWQSYQVVDVKKVDGQYLRTVYTYNPPPRPRLTEE